MQTTTHVAPSAVFVVRAGASPRASTVFFFELCIKIDAKPYLFHSFPQTKAAPCRAAPHSAVPAGASLAL